MSSRSASTSRTSFRAVDQCLASAGVRTRSSLSRPSAAARSAPILLSRSERSVSWRNSSEAAASSFTALGSSRRRARSDGSRTSMSNPISAASGSSEPRSAGSSMEMTSANRLRSSSLSAGSRKPVMPLSPYLKALATFSLALARAAAFAAPAVSAGRLLHGGPQPEPVHRDRVLLHLFLAAMGNNGPALPVNLEHQLVGLGFRVAEIALENIADVAHQIDGVIPDDKVPRDVRGGQGVGGHRRSGLDALLGVRAERNA